MTLVLVDFVAMKKCQSCIFFVKPFGQLSSLFFMNCLDLMYLIDLNLKPDSITNCVVKPKREAFRKKLDILCQSVKGHGNLLRTAYKLSKIHKLSSIIFMSKGYKLKT